MSNKSDIKQEELYFVVFIIIVIQFTLGIQMSNEICGVEQKLYIAIKQQQNYTHFLKFVLNRICFPNTI